AAGEGSSGLGERIVARCIQAFRIAPVQPGLDLHIAPAFGRANGRHRRGAFDLTRRAGRSGGERSERKSHAAVPALLTAAYPSENRGCNKTGMSDRGYPQDVERAAPDPGFPARYSRPFLTHPGVRSPPETPISASCV